jgi:SAM-dependent methyltransferase
MNKEAVKEFFNAWRIYDRALDLNYMFHNEIYRDVASLIKKRYGARSFSIFDLGCGSARHFAAALQGCTVSYYTGYDLSDIALEEAHRNLTSLGCSLEFKQADFCEGLKTGEGKADLIFSSYALHHLMSPAKERFFQLAHQRLAEQGMLLLIDVAREENEDRATYLDN